MKFQDFSFFFIIINKSKYENGTVLIILLKLPRTEKFSIGTEVKTSMYEMLKNILLASKIDKSKRLPIYNIVDSNIYYQRICIGQFLLFGMNCHPDLSRSVLYCIHHFQLTAKLKQHYFPNMTTQQAISKYH